MARIAFDEQLRLLDTELVHMAALVEQAIEGARRALEENDFALARRVMAEDKAVNEQEREIESLCLKLLLQQQPVARDLRSISTALKMITDLERIGDQAADIAEIVASMTSEARINRIAHLDAMADASASMVHDAVDAFVKRDLEAAYEVMATDDIIDAYFDELRTEIIEHIREHEGKGEDAVDYLMIAKYLERIGDHAQNIAEWVEYSITGIHKGGQLG